MPSIAKGSEPPRELGEGDPAGRGKKGEKGGVTKPRRGRREEQQSTLDQAMREGAPAPASIDDARYGLAVAGDSDR